MNIVIFGSTGLIGSHLENILSKDKNIKLFCVNRSLVNYQNKKIKYIKLNSKLNMKLPRNIDYIIYTIGLAHNLRNKKDDYFKVNVGLLNNILNRIKGYKIDNFIYLSSLKILGETGSFHLNSIPNPATAYSKSKYLAENQIFKNFKNTKTNIIILRLPIVISKNPKGTLKLMNLFANFKVPLPLKNANNSKSIIQIDSLGIYLKKLIMKKIINVSEITYIKDKDVSSSEIYTQLLSKKKIYVFNCPSFLKYLVKFFFYDYYKRIFNDFCIKL